MYHLFFNALIHVIYSLVSGQYSYTIYMIDFDYGEICMNQILWKLYNLLNTISSLIYLVYTQHVSTCQPKSLLKLNNVPSLTGLNNVPSLTGLNNVPSLTGLNNVPSLTELNKVPSLTGCSV